MQRAKFRVATVVMVLTLAPLSALADDPLAADASLNIDQALADNALVLDSIDNSLAFAVDITTDAIGAIGLNMTAGDRNLQDNAAVLALIDTASGEPSASTTLLQSVFGQSVNGAAASAHMHNVISADISASDDVAGNVGVNAASGAFNVQSDAVAIALVPAGMLAQSHASLSQELQQNFLVHHDVVNDMTATITLDGVSGNVGINLASGAGNVQSNSVTLARSF